MSGINGDKSRFHRLRKQKIQRRMRNHVMYTKLTVGQPGQNSSKASAAPAGKRNDAANE